MDTSRRIFQIHPLLYCNFKCKHCYSSSSPHSNKDGIEPEAIKSAILDASRLGYTTISISGGEPMMYPHLLDVLTFSKNLGLTTSIITNGSFPEKRYKLLSGLIDVIGVSIDGDKELHNFIRLNPNSYKKVDEFLSFSYKFFSRRGVVHTLTNQSWEMLPDILSFVKSKDIDHFQIHPLETIGRAKNHERITLDKTNLKRGYILAKLLQKTCRFPIQFDVYTKESAKITLHSNISSKENQASDVIDLIVLSENGSILPYTYGMPSKWAICDLNKQSLNEGWSEFRRLKLNSFQNYCKSSIESMQQKIFTSGDLFFENKQSKK